MLPSQVQRVKVPLLEKAADALRTDPRFEWLRSEAAAFRAANPWVEDSALFYCLANFEEELKGKAWWLWPEPIRWRQDPYALGHHVPCWLSSTLPCLPHGNELLWHTPWDNN